MPPRPRCSLGWLPLMLVVLAALWLRTHDLAQRAMHADEANQAMKFGDLLEHGHYAFDPLDHHGPTLYYAALPFAWFRGETSLEVLTETTVRLVPAIFGTLAVLLVAALAAPLGRWPALAAATFMAVSPPAVYYSRYFVHETLLVTFTLAALMCAQCWWRNGRARWAVATGACVGLMQATKESAPLFALAGLAALWLGRAGRPASTRVARDCSLAGVAALAVAGSFYASFGSHWSGIQDALAAYGYAPGRLTGTSGHEKPWWYYLQLFAYQRNGGLIWQQLGFFSLAIAGGVLALATRTATLRRVAIYTLLVAAVLSLTPYKTPWHAVDLVPGLALLAAGALAALPGWPLAATLAGIVVALQLAQTWRVTFAYAADARNPWAYVHSSPDVIKFRRLVETALGSSPAAVVRIISEEYWPLPWYLRGLSRVGYWTAPPADCDGALVVVSAGLVDTVRARLHGEYRSNYLGLRPGYTLVVLTPVP